MKRRSFLKAHALLLAAAFLGCGEGLLFPITNPPEVPAQSAGTIRIVTSTIGFDPQPPPTLESDGYLWKLDDSDFHEIGRNDSARVTRVEAGEHLVELTDLPSGCSVKGENPRSVMVEKGSQTEVIFEVDCSLAPR